MWFEARGLKSVAPLELNPCSVFLIDVFDVAKNSANMFQRISDLLNKLHSLESIAARLLPVLNIMELAQYSSSQVELVIIWTPSTLKFTNEVRLRKILLHLMYLTAYRWRQ